MSSFCSDRYAVFLMRLFLGYYLGPCYATLCERPNWCKSNMVKQGPSLQAFLCLFSTHSCWMSILKKKQKTLPFCIACLFAGLSLFRFQLSVCGWEWRIRRSTTPFQGVNVSACSQMQKTESWGGSEALAFDFCWISSRCAFCQVREVIQKEEWRIRKGERTYRMF